jgi:hypothetical protein
MAGVLAGDKHIIGGSWGDSIAMMVGARWCEGVFIMWWAIFLRGERNGQARGTWYSSVSIVVVPNGYRKSAIIKADQGGKQRLEYAAFAR